MNPAVDKPESSFKLNPMDDLNDLRMSAKALPLLEHVKRFIAETVSPMSEEFERLGQGKVDIWSYAPGQLEVLEAAKDKAKAEGLWNFFLPNAETGEGLVEPGRRLYRRGVGQEPDGVGDHELRGARHRQHGSSRTRRYAGSKGAMAEAAAGRQDPLGLRHDRAG
jgi:hypothetical protein